MSAIPVIGSIVDFAGGVAGFAEGMNSQRHSEEAARARAEANIIRNKENKINAQRQREMDIARVREKRAQIVSNAAANNQLGASSVQTSLGSLNSQLASNYGFSTMMEGIEDEYVQKENEAIILGNEASSEIQDAQAYEQFGRTIDQFANERF
jgi:hypothetical protein